MRSLFRFVRLGGVLGVVAVLTAACGRSELDVDVEAGAPEGGVCDPSTCNGCCSGGQCVDGTAASACGFAGSACTSCGATEQCVGGACIACGPSSCSGCCAAGQCLAGIRQRGVRPPRERVPGVPEGFDVQRRSMPAGRGRALRRSGRRRRSPRRHVGVRRRPVEPGPRSGPSAAASARDDEPVCRSPPLRRRGRRRRAR